jgi:uncharacterized protein DUF4260
LKRLAYAALGVVTAALAIDAVVMQHASWWLLVVFGIGPDLALIAGIAPGLAHGQLNPRAVPLYNAVHRYWVPIVMVAATIFTRSPESFAAGTAWIAHISFDRSLGFGLRTPEGFQRA